MSSASDDAAAKPMVEGVPGADWEFGNKGLMSETLDWTIKGGN